MCKGDKIALEDIRNNTICVKTKEGIRTMQFEDDIYLNLVYVNNLPINEKRHHIISKGEFCRYVDININVKFDLNKM